MTQEEKVTLSRFQWVCSAIQILEENGPCGEADAVSGLLQMWFLVQPAQRAKAMQKFRRNEEMRSALATKPEATQ